MITKAQVKAIGQEMEQALMAVITKHGFKSVRFSGGNIGTADFRISFEVGAEDASTALSNLFVQYGLPADSLNKKIALGNRTFTIVDIKPQNPAKPIIIVGAGGGRYKVSAREVKQALGIAPKPGTLIRRNLEDLMAEDEQKQDDMAPNIKAKFKALASQLSPENLHMDGEISRSQAAGRKGAIMSQWRKLEVLVGRKVSTSEFGV